MEENTEYYIGVDEAGRGSVLGDMFQVAVLVEGSRVRDLVAFGLRDSKELSPQRRRELFSIVVGISKCVVVKRYSPEQID